MDLLKLVLKLLELDIKSIMGILVWGNFALAILTFAYKKLHESSENGRRITKYVYTKFVQGVAWLFLFLRGDIPDSISVYLANVILFVGFYLESMVMLDMTKFEKGRTYRGLHRLQQSILVLCSLLFISTVFIFDHPNIRVAVASISVIAILIIPTIIYIFNKKSSKFKRFLGASIFLFILTLIPRFIVAFLDNSSSIFSNTLVQNGTFISLALIMFISGTGFLLLVYENTDENLIKMAELDSLTHLYNRRKFMSMAEAYFERLRIDKDPLTLLFIDIDYFKNANDLYGHSFGDEVLISLAKTVTDLMRVSDVCCRYGGEEFVVLLPNTNSENGFLISNRIKQQIEESRFEMVPEYRFTVSIGVHSGIPLDGEKIEDYIDKSDKAMYIAKVNGRNQIRVYCEQK